VPIARIAFLIAAPVCTKPEAHLLGHADFSLPANAQTEGPFRVTDKMPKSRTYFVNTEARLKQHYDRRSYSTAWTSPTNSGPCLNRSFDRVAGLTAAGDRGPIRAAC
jgi:hypothetical protein